MQKHYTGILTRIRNYTQGESGSFTLLFLYDINKNTVCQ